MITFTLGEKVILYLKDWVSANQGRMMPESI